MTPGEAMVGESAEMLAHHHPAATEMDAYERVLGDAMAGDASIFARQDYVEEAWRIVDPILKLATPAYEYEPGTWGPKEVATQIAPPNGSGESGDRGSCLRSNCRLFQVRKQSVAAVKTRLFSLPRCQPCLEGK